MAVRKTRSNTGCCASRAADRLGRSMPRHHCGRAPCRLHRGASQSPLRSPHAASTGRLSAGKLHQSDLNPCSCSSSTFVTEMDGNCASSSRTVRRMNQFIVLLLSTGRSKSLRPIRCQKTGRHRHNGKRYSCYHHLMPSTVMASDETRRTRSGQDDAAVRMCPSPASRLASESPGSIQCHRRETLAHSSAGGSGHGLDLRRCRGVR